MGLEVMSNPLDRQSASGRTVRNMSALDAARSRLDAALARLESAVGQSAALAPGAADGTPAAGEAELESLRAECTRLREALDESRLRKQALEQAADEVTVGLDRAIEEIAQILEG